MRHFIFCLSFVLSFSTCNGQQMEFKLKYLSSEYSKDSHSRTTLWTLEGNKLTWEEKLSGKFSRNKAKTLSLINEQIQLIESFLKEKELLQNISYQNMDKINLPYTLHVVDFVVKTSTDAFEIHISDYAANLFKNPQLQNIDALDSLLKSFMK